MTGGQSAVRMNDRHSFPVGGLVELSRGSANVPKMPCARERSILARGPTANPHLQLETPGHIR
jgi:hypothetical protein